MVAIIITPKLQNSKTAQTQAQTRTLHTTTTVVYFVLTVVQQHHTMVNRPPPRPGAQSKNEDMDTPLPSTAGKKRAGIRRGLEWSLRSMHKIDTSAQHFLSNYYGDDDNSDGDGSLGEDDTAYEIFKAKAEGESSDNGDSVWASLHAPLRTGNVDGKKKMFELKTNVTKRPTIGRKERLKNKHLIINSDRSGMEYRIRFWLMHFKVYSLSYAFLAAFVIMNAVYAAFFYALEEGCCGEPEMTFGDNFAFAIHTSTTIGYGTFSPVGIWSNFLVVFLSYGSTLMNTLFAGLLFTKFVTPVINIQFSDVLTLCNVNGVPCLSFRLGNPDGHENPLTDINVRLTYSYEIPYTDHKGEMKYFRQTEELKLLSSRQHGLLETWTLRHVLDEASPLFGLNFEEHPADKIYVFTLSIDAVQELTKSTVNIQAEYAVEDVLIGHSFINTESVDRTATARVATSDYSKISETEPYPVWYPAKAGDYAKGHNH